MSPQLSPYYLTREPSDIRLAQLEVRKRTDKVKVVDVAIGNVSLPTHPALWARIGELQKLRPDKVFQYPPTAGLEDAQQAFLNIIASFGYDTSRLMALPTDGGSQAMELVIAGCACRARDSEGGSGEERPILLIDPAYANYRTFAHRLGASTVAVARTLQDDGMFTLPSMDVIEDAVKKHRPNALVVIPYDNPTGQLFTREQMLSLARLCVAHDMWLVSDEAYRGLFYEDDASVVSVWGITDKEAPGIEGRRISIESLSKWANACGIHSGALVTDSNPLAQQLSRTFASSAAADYTSNLCASILGQLAAGGLARVPHHEIQQFLQGQREYYRPLARDFVDEMHRLLPGMVLSRPQAAIYTVGDVRNIVDGFDSKDFVVYCAREGKVVLDGEAHTLFSAPMRGFYDDPEMGRTQLRFAFVRPPDEMRRVPHLFKELLVAYCKARGLRMKVAARA